MKPDDSHSSDAAGGGAYLDGLTGRGGSSEAAREGAKLREALQPNAAEMRSIDQPSWQAIMARAREADTTPQRARRPAAANQWRWHQTASGVALFVALATTAIWIAHAPDESSAPTLRGTATPAIWRAENPMAAAREISQQLETAGARVTLTASGGGAVLEVACEASACPRINDVLARTETAVDSRGRLSLQVLPPR